MDGVAMKLLVAMNWKERRQLFMFIVLSFGKKKRFIIDSFMFCNKLYRI